MKLAIVKGLKIDPATKNKLKTNIKAGDMAEFWLTLTGKEMPAELTQKLKPNKDLNASMQGLLPIVKQTPMQPISINSQKQPQNGTAAVTPHRAAKQMAMEMMRKDSEGIFTPKDGDNNKRVESLSDDGKRRALKKR